MRHLAPFKVGQYEFKAYAEHVGGGVTEVTVCCDDRELCLCGRVAHQGKHDHTPEQFEKDITHFAHRLAEELAGTLRSQELAANFAKDQE